jgi:hypothetical protein
MASERLLLLKLTLTAAADPEAVRYYKMPTIRMSGLVIECSTLGHIALLIGRV